MTVMSRSPAAREQWSRIVDEQKSSGLTVKQFCAERSLCASTLFVWRRKLAAPPAEADHSTAFVEATIGDAESERPACEAGGVSIELPRGRRIIVERGFDRRLLLEVISALEGTSHAGTDGVEA